MEARLRQSLANVLHYQTSSAYLTMDPTNVAANVASMPAYQVSILDVFFPGFTSILSMAHGLSTGKLNTHVRMLLFGGFLIFLAKYIYGYINDLVNSHFSS
jgi:chaperone BCS1